MSKQIRSIGVLTSGGDAPGMNAAVRAVVRTAIFNDIKVYGIRHGYHGLINDQIHEMKSHDVAAIIQRGGTILKTARSKEFMTEEGMHQAYENVKKHGIDALVIIGGDGSFRGATAFGQRYDIPMVGLPGTIDNDIYGTDVTIGYDTALNTVIEAVDKIRDTASSHDRMFFVEVMGRDAGFLTLRAGLACGAEAILIPEVESDITKFIDFLENGHRRKKSSNIILVAEGEKEGGAFEVVKKLQPYLQGYDVRVSILGHIQRGGSPSAYDRFISTKMGVHSVQALINGHFGVMIGIQNEKIVHVPIEKAIKLHKTVDLDEVKMIDILNV
ncbi:MAG TPA: 6-phosphofructokinase [Bacteroidales bacterium]|jgi:6-phosphofructokinase 1|nr:6-phosphofructokinase [Bacteroidales bacterium]